MSDSLNRSSNINISGNSNISARDIVGGDYVIQNIIIIGRLLEFVGFEKLLPKSTDRNQAESVSAALEIAFSGTHGEDILNAASVTGAILEDFAKAWTSESSGFALRHRDMISSLPGYLVTELERRGFWNSYAELRGHSRQSWGEDILWLPLTQDLLKRQLGKDIRLGITKGMSNPHICYEKRTFSEHSLQSLYPESFDRDMFRVFMLGVVMDLIRLSSMAAEDRAFWNATIDKLAGK